MTSAEERIKEAFPDWEEWPEWAVELTVKTMKITKKSSSHPLPNRKTGV